MLSSTLQLCLHSDKAVQVFRWMGLGPQPHSFLRVTFWFLGGISTKCAATQWKMYFYICINDNRSRSRSRSITIFGGMVVQ